MLSTVIFFIVIYKSTFFEDRFGVDAYNMHDDPNDPHLHMIIYLQVAIISQALIFVTRSHSFSYLERPSFALMGAFCLAQLVACIIAAFGDWGFTYVRGISGGWIGIVWVWNIVWYVPLDFIKFAVRAAVIRPFKRYRHQKELDALASTGVPLVRTQSRAASVHESLYSNRLTFLQRINPRRALSSKPKMSGAELQRFSSISAHQSGQALQQGR